MQGRYPAPARQRRADGHAARPNPIEALEPRALLAATSLAVTPLPAPPAESQVNTFTTDQQRSPSIATDADGDYVVTWESYQQEGLDWNVYAQRYAADGTRRGAEFRVNQDALNYNTDSSVAMDGAGNFVVTWTQGPYATVYARQFNADGTARGDEFIVDWTAWAGTSSVAMDPAGDFVVAWDITGDDDRSNVFCQWYLANGNDGRQGIVQVNTNATGSASMPDVAIDPAGDFVVTYKVGADDTLAGTYVRTFTRAAVSSQPPAIVSAGESVASPAVGMGAAGDFVVAWAGTDGTHARRYNPAGLPSGDDILVGPSLKTPAVDVTADAQSNFLVAWSGAGADGQCDVFARGYNPDGTAVGGQFRLNSNVSNQQTGPVVALRADRSFVSAWNSWGQDGDLGGIFARTFPNTAPPASSVVGRRVFYNRSVFDGPGGIPNAADDYAIATSKFALLPGGLPSFFNVTSYTKGINGVMVDVSDLPFGVTLNAGDFVFRTGALADPLAWSAGPAPMFVSSRTIAPGRIRVTLTWRDYDPDDTGTLPEAVANGWLEVTLKATDRTGLAAPDVFYFGNLIGETGGVNAAGVLGVTGVDIGRVKTAQLKSGGAAVNNPYDFNRDGRVNALDLQTVRDHETAAIPLLAIPTLKLTAPAASVAALTPARRSGYATSILG